MILKASGLPRNAPCPFLEANDGGRSQPLLSLCYGCPSSCRERATWRAHPSRCVKPVGSVSVPRQQLDWSVRHRTGVGGG